MIAFAQETIVANADTLLSKIKVSVINPLIMLMIGVALVVFIYGIFEMVRGANDPGARDKGKLHIIWGVIGLAIMVSVFGIMNLICDTIGAGCQ